MTAYLIDSNVFIQAKNLHYGFDFCPAFWNWLVEQNDAGTVASIDKVADELQAGDDELAEWAATRGNKFFLPPDDAVLHGPDIGPEGTASEHGSYDEVLLSSRPGIVHHGSTPINTSGTAGTPRPCLSTFSKSRS